MRMQIVLAMLVFATLAAGRSTQAQSMAPLPSGWPKQLELGMADSPGGAAAMKSTAPFAFRYQYLAGGVNTGNGWANWNTNGDFARFYIQDSVANGIIPVFTYYMLLQSAPGGGSESNADLTNLNNTATMTAYYNDLKLFFQKAGAFHGQLVVLHVEPDLWGYIEQASTNGDAATVAAKVSETGLTELAGLPSNVSGFARAVAPTPRRLRAERRRGLSHQRLGHRRRHRDFESARRNRRCARRACRGVLQVARRQFRYRPSASSAIAIPAFTSTCTVTAVRSWWDADDFRRSARFLGGFSTATSKRIVMWQIPLGDTRMRSQNNTTGHYQDNRPEWLLDEPARTHLAAYRDAGVVAFLFGGGAGGTTCACDGQGDGVTNPAAINGNSHVAASGSGTPSFNGTTLTTPYAADDDGGFFRWKAWQYYQAGAMTFSGALSAPTGLKITPPKH